MVPSARPRLSRSRRPRPRPSTALRGKRVRDLWHGRLAGGPEPQERRALFLRPSPLSPSSAPRSRRHAVAAHAAQHTHPLPQLQPVPWGGTFYRRRSSLLGSRALALDIPAPTSVVASHDARAGRSTAPESQCSITARYVAVRLARTNEVPKETATSSTGKGSAPVAFARWRGPSPV